MRDIRFGFAYLSVIIVPSAIALWISSLMNLDSNVIVGIVFMLSCLMVGEITAKYKAQQGVWSYISNSLRNKIAFSVSLTFFLYWFVYPVWFEVHLPFATDLIWMVTCPLIGFLLFILLATQDLRLTILKKIIPHRNKSNG
jgi:hypothetical protein